jgi:hypothetical protein
MTPHSHKSPCSEPDPEDQTANLTEAIMLMTQELRRREVSTAKRAKANEPDTFDGSNPRNLNNFILLCNLYFRQNLPYSDNATKVTFALSYLCGTALEYFEPSILNSVKTPDWMDNWSAFIRTLHTQFGPIDPAVGVCACAHSIHTIIASILSHLILSLSLHLIHLIHISRLSHLFVGLPIHHP